MKVLRNSKFTPVLGLIIGVAIGFVCFRLTTVNAGNLEPSAAPGPTMKTLDEVEARIPIPGSATAAATFVIDSPGSYYLTGNRSCSGRGISVEANDVTIDLNGYVLWGSGSGTYSGIYMNGRTNVEIRNGTIENFGYYGIYESDSVNGGDHRVINIRAITNKQRGIYLYCKGNLIKECTASGNLGAGIYVYDSSNIIGNIAKGNGSDGIHSANSCTLQNNIVQGNTGYGIYASNGSTLIGNMSQENGNHGIYATNSCTLQNNISLDNTGDGIYSTYGSTLIGNTSHNNTGDGIYASYGTTIISNTVYENDENGIYSYTSSLVADNTARNNNLSNATDGAGISVYLECTVRGNTLTGNLQQNIYASGRDNVIENNTVLASTYGINFGGAGCFYANNRASGNTTAGYGGNIPTGDGDGGGNADF